MNRDSLVESCESILAQRIHSNTPKTFRVVPRVKYCFRHFRNTWLDYHRHIVRCSFTHRYLFESPPFMRTTIFGVCTTLLVLLSLATAFSGFREFPPAVKTSEYHVHGKCIFLLRASSSKAWKDRQASCFRENTLTLPEPTRKPQIRQRFQRVWLTRNY